MGSIDPYSVPEEGVGRVRLRFDDSSTNLLRFLVIAATIDLAYALVVKMAYHVSLSRRRSPVRIRSSAPVLDTIHPLATDQEDFYLYNAEMVVFRL